ncbi:hypothetical protein Pint_10304 [Pistacia integerrima]|uniref:Uncharacterized protein n=1 Tax=Pistacia integerrima TaxID=434235 RepID=A0ACC0XG09_9ROSI|nr:hypothetical protein Pint_10304 [Pistacia integerrima]
MIIKLKQGLNDITPWKQPPLAFQHCVHRSIFKIFSNVFQINSLPFGDQRQHNLQKLCIFGKVIGGGKSFHLNPLKNNVHHIVYTFSLAKIVL